MRTREIGQARSGLVIVACFAALGFAISGCSATKEPTVDHFVTRSGQRLLLNGRPWRFIGFNDYELMSMPARTHCGRTITERTLNSILQDDENSGASVVRTWFFQSYYDMTNDTGHWHRSAPSWAAFDRLLTAAAAHHLRVIPVLVNEWPNCEPSTAAKGIGFFTGGYTLPEDGYPLSFKQYAITVARHYADDPTIAFWQLGNEFQVGDSGTCDEHASAVALRSFADTMTAALQSVDPHHLVSLGTAGADDCGLVGSDYAYVHAGRVDICEYHDYGNAARSMPDGSNSLAERIAQCRALDKPLFIGESGIPADTNDFGQSTGKITSASLQLRAGFFDAKITAAFQAGVVGYVIWDKRQDASNSLINYDYGRFMVGPNDPTNRVTAELARTLGATPGSIKFGFEDGGLDSWRARSSPGPVQLVNSNEEAWGGDRSLKLRLTPSTRLVFAFTHATAGAGARTTVTYHVYVSSIAPPGALVAAPFVTGQSGRLTADSPIKLLPGWNVVQWTIPSSISTPLRKLGIEIGNRLGWGGPLFLDSIGW